MERFLRSILPIKAQFYTIPKQWIIGKNIGGDEEIQRSDTKTPAGVESRFYSRQKPLVSREFIYMNA